MVKDYILHVSKSFQANANYYGTTEYRKMNEIFAVYPDMKIELYAATRKKSLTYEMMQWTKYINIILSVRFLSRNL